MTWLILIAALVAIGWGLSAHLRGKLNANLSRAIILVKMGMFTELSKRYTKSRGEEGGKLLAGAVVNYLFNSPPTNETAREYLESHVAIVESLAAEYVKHAGVRETLTQAMLFDKELPSADAERSPDDKRQHYQALLDRSWINNFSVKRSPQEFLDLVAEFSLERSANK